MDYQILFNLSVAVAAFFGGFLLERISRAVERLDGDVRALPLNYVTKDDYKSDIKEVKDILGKIFDRLESKADK
jgi:hypothetical protein